MTTYAPALAHAARATRPVGPARSRGLSLVELMVALALGLVLTFAAGSVYLSSKTAFHHQQQLSAVQQSVRLAFDFLAADVRMAGYMGCFTGQDSSPDPDFAGAALATRYALGIEGYDYKTNAAYTIASAAPSNDSTATNWEANADTNGTTLTVTGAGSVAGNAAGDGLTPGSDVLVVRTVAGRGARVTANTAAGSTLSIESIAGGKCPDGTDRISGLCANSHALLASCTAARRFAVTSVTGTTLTVPGRAFLADEYTTPSSEVYPLQTVAYYVKKSSSGTTTSLYRRVFDGTVADGVEQELVEGVETLQLRYGRDTSTPAADGIVNDYVSAKDVADWSRVVTVRMSLLLRSPETVTDVAMAASGVVNGVAVTYPDRTHDRRVFTTTVAVRNKIAFF